MKDMSDSQEFQCSICIRISCNTQAVKAVQEEVAKMVYAFPKADFLAETAKGVTGHHILKEAAKSTDKAGITRAENLIMVAIQGNNAKTRSRVSSTTAELTNRMKTDWRSMVYNLVADLGDSVLKKGGDDEEKKEKKKKIDDEGEEAPKKKKKVKP